MVGALVGPGTFSYSVEMSIRLEYCDYYTLNWLVFRGIFVGLGIFSSRTDFPS